MSTHPLASVCPNHKLNRSLPYALLLVCGTVLAALPITLTAGALAQDFAKPAARVVPGTPVKLTYTAIIDGEPTPITDDGTMGDPATIRRILDEGRTRNQVMNHITYLTQKIGNRLTGSNRIEQASAWLRENYKAWGLFDVHTEQWGTIATRFDRGPSTGKVFYISAAKSDPSDTKYDLAREMQLSTLSWTAGTNGQVRGKVVRMPKDDAEYAALKAKDAFRNAWILMEAPPAVGQRGVRSRASATMETRIEARKDIAAGKKKIEELPIRERLMFDGINGWIATSRDERVWTGAISGWREREAEDIPPDIQVSIRLSDYDFINSRLTDGDAIEVEFDLQHKITPGPVPVYNTIAEIPGTDLASEIVIISGHMDSWDGPGSMGTTDNGTGTVVTHEAARILMAAGAKPRRTIRFIHYSGEEQGLLGSKGYVDSRKADGTLQNISAVFVDDGGTNSQGGLPAIASMVPMLAAATAPVNDQFFDSATGKPLNVNVHTVKSMPRGGSSDHASFNGEGIPGFFWDEVGRADYGFGWHTQNDKTDLAIAEYLMQSATCSAVTAYRLACAPTLLPRQAKPEPKAEPKAEPKSDAKTSDAAPAAPDAKPAAKADIKG